MLYSPALGEAEELPVEEIEVVEVVEETDSIFTFAPVLLIAGVKAVKLAAFGPYKMLLLAFDSSNETHKMYLVKDADVSPLPGVADAHIADFVVAKLKNSELMLWMVADTTRQTA